MIAWPESLIREVATRRCVLFLGAGVSASAQTQEGMRPKDWLGFLNAAAELVSEDHGKADVLRLIAEKKYLVALQAIKSSLDGGDYHDFLNRNFNVPNFRPSDLHRVIYDLDSRVVITTNFDKIYETYCFNSSEEADQGFKVLDYTSASLADELRSDNRLIVKAHGSIDNIGGMIFTRAEYHKAKRDHSSFYALLKAIFLTSTVIFIGCSLDDPDMALLLEDVNITASSNRPHYVLIRQNSTNQFALQDWQNTYNVRALQYGPDHNNLVSDLQTLKEAVEGLRASLQTIAA